MPAAILKVLALSGVISAGCFAVWKANTELATADSATTTEKFTDLSGDDSESIGLGGEAVPKSDEKPSKESDEIALADFDFAKEAADEEPAPSRAMPAAFPAAAFLTAEQSEPDTSDSAKIESTEPTELSGPEPGVASLEALENAEAKPAQPNPAREPTPIRRASAEVSAAPRTPALSQLPTRTDAPILMTPPNPGSSSGSGRSRERVIPANAESIETAAGSNEEAPTLPGELLPENVGAASEPASQLPEIRARGTFVPRSTEAGSGTGMQINPQGSRTRGVRNPVPDPVLDVSNEEPQPELNSNPPGGIDSQVEPADAAEVENPFDPRNRTRVPATSVPRHQPNPATPEPTILNEEPAAFSPAPGRQPARTPTTNHAIGESVSPDNVPRKSSIPGKALSENLLIGDGTIDDPAITPTLQPQIRVEKRAQAEAEIGEKLIYEIIVQNVGQVPAHAVVVEERIPKGTRMERSQPQAKLGRDKVLHWDFGTMAAGSQKVIKVEVTPLEPGPIGSVATVRFATQVATTTKVTAPTLSLEVDHPREVSLGEQVPFHFVVTNTGTGVAKNVKLRTILQPGLDHRAGLDLDKKLGTLAPGQSQRVDLAVTAAETGGFAPRVIVTTGEEANEFEQENRTLDLNVIKSSLTLSRDGHARRFVNRPAEFATRVKNHSIEVMRDVHVVETLPPGVVPVGDMSNYRWNPKNRTVEWTIKQLGPEHYSDLKLNVVSDRAGELQGKVEAYVGSTLRAELPTTLEVAGFPALKVDIYGGDEPVAVDDQVSMRVTISNSGSAPATSVQALFELPAEMNLVGAKGPVDFTQDGKVVTFAALEELAPNDKKTFDIVLTAAQEGSSSVAVDVYSDDRKDDPVRQEEAVTIIPK